MSKRFAHFLVVVLLMTGFQWLTTPHKGPYSYDEADYMYAAAQGWWAQWNDSPSLSMLTFVKTGLGAGDPAMRSQLSETIRQSGDIVFYRHWHGPLYFYGLSWLDPLDEAQVRAVISWIPTLGIMLIYLGTLWTFPGRILPAFLAAAFYGASYAVVNTTEVAPHQLFVIVSLVPLFFLAKLHLTSELRWWWWAVASTALAFVTMEIAFVGIGVLLLTGWLYREKWRLSARGWWQSAAVFAAVVVALWPAGIWKLSPVRSYLFMAYLAVFRKGAWGNVTFAGTWMARLQNAPLEWLLVPAAVMLWWFGRRKPEVRATTPFLLFGMLMLMVTLKVYSFSPRYALPVLAPLLVAAGLILGLALETRRTMGKALAGILVLALGAETWIYTRAHPPFLDQRATRILATFRAQPPQGPILIPKDDVPFFHFYLPGIRYKTYLSEEEKRTIMQSGGLAAVLVDDTSTPILMP